MTNQHLIELLMGFPRQAEVRASTEGNGVVIKAQTAGAPIVIIHLPPEGQ